MLHLEFACISIGFDVFGWHRHMKAINPKGKPVPVRFTKAELDFLAVTTNRTGLNSAEVVRRAVRLMERQQRIGGSYSFLLELAA